LTRTRGPLSAGRLLAWLLGSTLLLTACLALGAALGADRIPLARMVGGWGAPAGEAGALIFWQVRLPRVLLAATLGGSLTAAGIAFQAILRNPLADPYILGVSGGASVGGILALIAGLGAGGAAGGSFLVQVCAFLGALAALLLVEWIATVEGRLTVYTLLLTGAVFNAFSGALIFFLQSLASIEELHSIVFYLMGSIPSLPYGTIGGMAGVALGTMAVLLAMARDYNVLSLGEEGAMQLGLDVERIKRRTFIVGSLLTGLSVAAAGLIGFVGLIVPHLLRLVLGSDHRLLLPVGFLCGASFLVLADLGARLLLAPNEIPVGVVTALVGGPFFIYLMRRSRNRYGVL
jgi:iron complex transport system permease protein